MKAIPKNLSHTALTVLFTIVSITGCSNGTKSSDDMNTDMPNTQQGMNESTDAGAITDPDSFSGNDVDADQQGSQQGSGSAFSPDANQEFDNTPDQGAAQPDIINAALVYFSEETGSTEIAVDSTTTFYSITNPLSEEPLLKEMVGLDTCEIGAEYSQINAEAFDLPIDHVLDAQDGEVLQVSSVSAGESVELSSASGTYVSLLKNEVEEEINYKVQEGADLNMMLPELLTLGVSGDTFPVMESTWVTPARLSESLRDGVRSIDTSAELTWVAADHSGNLQSNVQIHAVFLDEVSGAVSSYNCVLEDDGTFTLPEDVQALYEDGASATFVDVARYTRSYQLVDGISVVNVFLQKF